MSEIIRSGSKIIENLAGEILTESDALIDLRSTYGVIKGVGDEVENGKYFNKPIMYRAVNSPCIEDGDGFDFSSNINGWLSLLSITDIYGDFFIGWWGKYKTEELPSNKQTFGAYASSSPSLYCGLSKLGTKITLYTNGVDVVSEFLVYVVVNLTEWNYFSIERIGTNVYFCRNGLLSYIDNQPLTTLTCNKNKLQFGNTGGVNNQANDGKLDNLVIYPKSFNNYTGKNLTEKVFTPPKRSSDNE